ncbi:MAG: hypothetical protein Q9N67_08405 [Ghiorsea sp.]|nr:hypothetical protein [Ghiorsea sp.]
MKENKMKRYFCAFMVMISFNTISYAGEPTGVVLKIGAPGSIMFESAVTEKLSLGLEIAGSRFYPEASSYERGGGVVNARAIGTRATWQSNGAFNKGAYLSGWFDYLTFDYESFNVFNGSTTASSSRGPSTVAAGVMIGYQYLYGSELILNFGAGYGFMKGTDFNTTTETTTYDAFGNITSTSSAPSSATLKTTDVFIFDIYIGYLF